MGSFSENHDEPRFASYTSDISVSNYLDNYIICELLIISAGKKSSDIHSAHGWNSNKYDPIKLLQSFKANTIKSL